MESLILTKLDTSEISDFESEDYLNQFSAGDIVFSGLEKMLLYEGVLGLSVWDEREYPNVHYGSKDEADFQDIYLEH